MEAGVCVWGGGGTHRSRSAVTSSYIKPGGMLLEPLPQPVDAGHCQGKRRRGRERRRCRCVCDGKTWHGLKKRFAAGLFPHLGPLGRRVLARSYPYVRMYECVKASGDDVGGLAVASHLARTSITRDRYHVVDARSPRTCRRPPVRTYVQWQIRAQDALGVYMYEGTRCSVRIQKSEGPRHQPLQGNLCSFSQPIT